jgi:hypothetical protein
VEAVNNPAERRRRGRLAREEALHRLSWPTLAARLDRVLTEVAGLPTIEPDREPAAGTLVDG